MIDKDYSSGKVVIFRQLHLLQYWGEFVIGYALLEKSALMGY